MNLATVTALGRLLLWGVEWTASTAAWVLLGVAVGTWSPDPLLWVFAATATCLAAGIVDNLTTPTYEGDDTAAEVQ